MRPGVSVSGLNIWKKIKWNSSEYRTYSKAAYWSQVSWLKQIRNPKTWGCEQKSILIWFAHVRCWCLPVSACLYLSQPVSTWLYLSLPVSTHLYPSLPVYTCLSLSLLVLTCLLALTHWSESPTLSWWNGKVRITLQGVHVCIIGPHNAELAVSPLILPLSITRISQGLFE